MLKNSLLLAVTCALAFFATPAFSQQMGTGTIDGRIVDATGAVLPGVSVTLTNAETGLSRTVVTDGNGRFRIPLLPVGRYVLTTDLAGFQSLRRDGLVLNVGQQQSLGDLTIEVATVEEVVTVTAESPLIEVARAVPAATFDSRKSRTSPSPDATTRIRAEHPERGAGRPRQRTDHDQHGRHEGHRHQHHRGRRRLQQHFFGSATGQPEFRTSSCPRKRSRSSRFSPTATRRSSDAPGASERGKKSGTNDVRGSAFFSDGTRLFARRSRR
jgi:hypothetical protein